MAYNAQGRGYPQPTYDRRAQQYVAPYNGVEQNDRRERSQEQWSQLEQPYAAHQHNAYNHNGQYYAQYDDQVRDQHQPLQYGHDAYDSFDSYPSQDAPPQRQQRQYHYDERFHSNGRAPRGDGMMRPSAGRRSPQTSRPGTAASSHRNRQDRILEQKKPESPKAMAWDNPFGVFPGTKKDIEKRKKQADEARSQSREDVPSERPSTASSSRPRPTVDNTHRRQNSGEGRPHTSHGQRLSQDKKRAMPPRQLDGALHGFAPQAIPRQGNEISQQAGLPIRPAPMRSAAGPPNQHPSYAVAQEQIPQHYRGHSLEEQHQHYDTALSAPNQNFYQESEYQDQRNRSNIYAAELPSHEPLPRSKVTTSPPRLAELPVEADQQDTSHYQHNALRHENTNFVSPENVSRQSAAPNFAAMVPGATENVEKQITLQTNMSNSPIYPQPYRRPTYGEEGPKPVPMRPGLAMTQSPISPSAQGMQPPMNDFDFGLNEKQPQAVASHYNAQHYEERRAHENSSQGEREDPAQYTNTNYSQFSPRGASRPQEQRQNQGASFVHSYNRPAAAAQYSQAAVQPSPRSPEINAQTRQPPPSRAEYGFDERGYPETLAGGHAAKQGYHRDAYQSQNQLAMHHSHSEPSMQYNDSQYGSGRIVQQPRRTPLQPPAGSQIERAQTMQDVQAGSLARHDYQELQRPRTANSTRNPTRQYMDQSMPDLSTSVSALPLADRHHPPPIRPGLMPTNMTTNANHAPRPYPQEAPPPAVQQQPSPPRPQSSKPPSKSPVTIQELNDLRLAYKDRPNDDKLGLHFAKRLVEAATVLASEGDKADAKTTARNRERYINDAYRIVKKLAANGSPDAMFYLADCYGQGQLGLEVNPKEAFHLYNSAAKVGHPQSAYRVAVCCELGQDAGGGTRRDHLKAVQFYKKAATLGDGPAMFKMGMILLKGLLGHPVNRREGISWLKRAADKADEDNPHALHELATLYENAQSTDVIIKDERYALQLYTQAANLGYKYSQHRLGTAYEYGTLGLQIDPRMSIAWYSKAAAQGEHQSEFALSGWYLTGSEPLLAQSDTEAYLWARKAAQTGLAKAEYAMGYYSEVGIGCRPDIEEAKKWYFRAAGKC